MLVHMNTIHRAGNVQLKAGSFTTRWRKTRRLSGLLVQNSNKRPGCMNFPNKLCDIKKGTIRGNRVSHSLRSTMTDSHKERPQGCGRHSNKINTNV